MADPTSILASLAQRSDEIEEAQKLTLQVPRWTDPEIYVTYNLLETEQVEKVWHKLKKVKKPTSAQKINANADILIIACDSIYAVIDGKKYSFGPDPEGELTRFDEAMAERLQLEEKTARAVVRKVFKADGDILQHVRRLSEWSGLAAVEADEEFEGE